MANEPETPAPPASGAPVAKTVADKITDLAPAYFAELMQQFIEKKDLTDRQKIRRRVRALLDLFSADTKWPTDRGPKNERPGRNAFGNVQQMDGGFFHGGRNAPPQDDLAEPEPMGAVPAPGADIAEGGAGVGAAAL